MAGLPASGKSSLAKRLARALPATLLDKDSVRHFLFGTHVDYSGAQNDLVMGIAYEVSAYLHTQQRDIRILIDGRTFSESTQVTTLKQQARRMGTPLRLIECTCSEASARTRLARDAGTHLAADRDFDMYLRRRAAAEPITEPKLVLDTDVLSLDDCEAKALAWLQESEGIREPDPVTGRVVVIDIGGTKTRIGHISHGLPCDEFQTIDSQRLNRHDAANALAEIIGSYCHARAFSPDAVVAGIPGILDRQSETISHCNNLPALEGTGLRKTLETLLRCRVLFEQDTMLQVLGEWRAGVARGHDSVIGTYFGTGIGGTWLKHGQSRSSPAACLQAGHIPAGFAGRRCACGNLDCVEAYASGHTLRKLAAAHRVPLSEIFMAFDGLHELPGEPFPSEPSGVPDRTCGRSSDQPTEGPSAQASHWPLDRPLAAALSRFIQHQAALLATLVTIAGPDMIVIGGGIPAMPGYPRDALIVAVREHLQKPMPANRNCLGFAELGNEAPLHGALALLQEDSDDSQRHTFTF